MRPTGLFAVLLAACLAAPAAAQSPDQSPGQSPGPAPSSPEFRIPEELDQAFREMIDKLRPALEEMMKTMRVFEDIDGIENYEMPEVLPNGDIIIRRRDDAPPWPPGETAPEADPPGDGVKT